MKKVKLAILEIFIILWIDEYVDGDIIYMIYISDDRYR